MITYPRPQIDPRQTATVAVPRSPLCSSSISGRNWSRLFRGRAMRT